ncbi:MAG: hypothetical protein ABIV13_01100 [Fimbriimonadales bacterium]
MPVSGFDNLFDPATISTIESAGCAVKRIEVQSTDEGFAVRAAVKGTIGDVISRLAKVPGVRSTSVEDGR